MDFNNKTNISHMIKIDLKFKFKILKAITN